VFDAPSDVLHLFASQTVLAECYADLFGRAHAGGIVIDDPRLIRDPALERLGQALAVSHTQDAALGKVFADSVSLAIVCPAIVVLALLARRGSLAAHLAWLGTLAFTVYNYVIYTLSIHVGPLFLPWIAVLSLSLFALIGGSAILDPHAVAARFQHPRTTLAGWFLIIIAALFAALWLRDLIPSIASGEVPAGARELGLPSNPVHVLDLSFYLPAATVAGIQLVRRRPLGYLIGPGMLVFLGLTGLPILLTPFIADARGESPGWPLLAPMATVVIVSLGLATRLLRTARRTTGTPPDRETDPAGTRPVEAS